MSPRDAKGSRRARRARRRSPLALFSAIAVVVTLGLTLLAWRLGASWLIAYLVAINVTTLFFYGYDKAASSRARLRVPERALHLLAFAGGTPAALAGQRLFRHKTLKRRFRVLFWSLCALQAALVVAWLCWRASR